MNSRQAGTTSAASSQEPVQSSSLAAQASWVLVAKTLAFLASFAFPMLVVRRLNQVEYGLYKQVFLIVNTALTILPMGVAMSAYYFLPRETQQRSQVVFNILLFHAVGGLLTLAVLTLFPTSLVWLFNAPEMAGFAQWIGFLILFWSVSSLLESVAIANSEVKLAMVFIVATNATRAVLMIGAILLNPTVHALIIGAFIHGVLQSLVMLAYLRSRFGQFWKGFKWAFMRTQMAYASPFGFAAILYHLENDLHRYFVSHQFGPATYAIYSIGCFQSPVVDLVGESVSSVSIPRISHLQSVQRRDEIVAVVSSMIKRLVMIFVPFYVFLLLTGREVITVLFTDAYLDSWPIFAVNLTMIPLAALTTAFDPVLRAYAQHRFFLVRVRIALLAVLIVGLWWATRQFGLIGAISTVVGIAILEQVLAGIKVLRILEVSRIRLEALKHGARIVASASVAGAVTYAVRAAYLMSYDPLARIILCGVALGFAYISMMLLIGGIEQEDVDAISAYVAAVRGTPRT